MYYLKKAILNDNSPLMVLVFLLDSYRKAVGISTFQKQQQYLMEPFILSIIFLT
jgi:hypothetical protein